MLLIWTTQGSILHKIQLEVRWDKELKNNEYFDDELYRKVCKASDENSFNKITGT